MALMPKQLPHGWRASAIATLAVALSLNGAPVAAADDGAGSVSSPLPETTPGQSQCIGADQGSTAGYADVSSAKAEDLFTEHFPCILDSLAADPPNPHPAPDGTGGPLMTTDQNGAEVPVDLSLKSTGDGFTPAEPLVGLTLPDDLGHEVALGDRGITIDIGATDASAARSAGAQSLNGEGLFYTEAAPATDVLLAPYSLGLKAIYQLRAPQSPEHLPMRLRSLGRGRGVRLDLHLGRSGRPERLLQRLPVLRPVSARR